MGEGLAVDELHGVVVDAALAADGVDRHDVLVGQVSCGLSLILEPLKLLGVEHGREREHLQRHPAPERNLLGLVHHTHSTTANLANDAIVAQFSGELPIAIGLCDSPVRA